MLSAGQPDRAVLHTGTSPSLPPSLPPPLFAPTYLTTPPSLPPVLPPSFSLVPAHLIQKMIQQYEAHGKVRPTLPPSLPPSFPPFLLYSKPLTHPPTLPPSLRPSLVPRWLLSCFQVPKAQQPLPERTARNGERCVRGAGHRGMSPLPPSISSTCCSKKNSFFHPSFPSFLSQNALLILPPPSPPSLPPSLFLYPLRTGSSLGR